MPVTAITPDYEKFTEHRDLPELYHGNQMIFVHWEHHMSFVAAIALPLPPQTPFAVIKEAIGGVYAPHADWAEIDWSQVVWSLDGQPATPDFSKSLADHGLGHKSLIRFWTPGLDGYHGAKI